MQGSIVAEILAIVFEPEVRIFNRDYLKFKRESVSLMRECLPTFPQICLCHGDKFFWRRKPVSVIRINCPQNIGTRRIGANPEKSDLVNFRGPD